MLQGRSDGLYMQIILLLIELFIPEIAQKLSGDSSAVLRSRLLHAAIGLLALALLIIAWALFSHLVVKQLPVGQFDPVDPSVFTAWLLAMIGLGLLVLSRYEYSEKRCGNVDQSLEVDNTQDCSLIPDAQVTRGLHQGVVKTKTINLQECLDGTVPSEEWSFFVAGQYCRLVNNMASGSMLYVNNSLVAQNTNKMRFGTHKQPDLRTKITDKSGNEYEVAIFFRAWLHIRVRVAINGKYLSEKLV